MCMTNGDGTEEAERLCINMPNGPNALNERIKKKRKETSYQVSVLSQLSTVRSSTNNQQQRTWLNVVVRHTQTYLNYHPQKMIISMNIYERCQSVRDIQ